MAIRQIDDFKIKEIANAIRSKTGKTDALTLGQMATEIAGIQTGGNIQAGANGISFESNAVGALQEGSV